MKIDLKKMKYAPKELPCCEIECIHQEKERVCELNPLDCADFFFYNFDEIQKQKRGISNEKKEADE